MFTAIALTTMKLLSPPGTPPQADPQAFDSRLSHVEYAETDAGVEIVAFDTDGTPIGVLGLFVDRDGDLWLVSEYDDGYQDIEFVPGASPLIAATLPAEVIQRRAEMIVDHLADLAHGPQAKKSWLVCGLKVAATAAGCAAAQPVPCVGGAGMAACECLPLIVKEWKEQSCF